jgi:hypothetical protein
MTEWDRKALLGLVDEAGRSLHAPDLTVAQRHSLRELLDHYGPKAKSINACQSHVQSMKEQLDQILKMGNNGA